MVWDNQKLIEILKDGGVAVMPTDTLYGIVGRAEDRNVVEKIYKIRKRASEKPCIILLGDISELKKFGIVLTDMEQKEIEKLMEPTSFVLDYKENLRNEKFLYLHRGMKSLVFRVPAPQALRDLLLEVGPLIAPSANIEGLPPAKNILEAKEYFGDSVDLYVDGGNLADKASKIIKLHKDHLPAPHKH